MIMVRWEIASNQPKTKDDGFNSDVCSMKCVITFVLLCVYFCDFQLLRSPDTFACILRTYSIRNIEIDQQLWLLKCDLLLLSSSISIMITFIFTLCCGNLLVCVKFQNYFLANTVLKKMNLYGCELRTFIHMVLFSSFLFITLSPSEHVSAAYLLKLYLNDVFYVSFSFLTNGLKLM